ncbi:DUF4893 domain-containing protein [Pseudomonas aeruginosa]
MSRPIPVSRVFACPHRSRRLRACRRRRTGLAWLHQRIAAAAACWPSSRTAEAINKRYYDSAFEEFLPELEQLELSLAQPVVAVDEKGLLGDWKCRSTQADQYGIYRYPNFQCRIRRTDRGLFLAKTSGSQRVSGYLFREGTQRYVFLGGATVNDEPQVAFSGLAHGAPAESDVVASAARTPVASSCCSRNGAAATRSSSSAAEAQALSSP